jgi:hypothetical protein
MTKVYLDSQNRLHHELLEGRCPHCGALAHRTVLAYPSIDRVRQLHPEQLGVVLQCDACRTPLFRRYRVAEFAADRVLLQPAGEDLEHAAGPFPLRYLPTTVGESFREALACFGAGLFRAFALMCRVTVQAMLEDLGEPARLRQFDHITEFGMLAGLADADVANLRRALLEGSVPEAADPRAQAALLLEATKDLLQQSYVRRGRVAEALQGHGLGRVAPPPQVLPRAEPAARALRR